MYLFVSDINNLVLHIDPIISPVIPINCHPFHQLSSFPSTFILSINYHPFHNEIRQPKTKTGFFEFQLFAKLEVNGENEHKMYTYLKVGHKLRCSKTHNSQQFHKRFCKYPYFHHHPCPQQCLNSLVYYCVKRKKL